VVNISDASARRFSIRNWDTSERISAPGGVNDIYSADGAIGFTQWRLNLEPRT
jgi:hypothetical protein